MIRSRVIHVTTIDISLRLGLFSQLQALQSAGYEVIGACSPGKHGDFIRQQGIPLYDVRMSRRLTPFQDLISLMALYCLFRRIRPEVVHTHNPKPSLLGQLAAKLAGVPCIVNTLHGFYFHEHMNPIWRLFYISLEKIAAYCSDSILSQSREDMETAVRHRICPPSKIAFLGNGIDLTKFSPANVGSGEMSTLLEKLGMNDKTPIVGFVGRLAARRKGFLDFLRAGQLVVQSIPNVRFLIVGEADHGKPDAVEPARARDFGIDQHCIFLGHRPYAELPALLSLMDVLVLPSLFEGVPRAVMEASSMGVPAVVTNVKGNREAVEHDRNGLIVPLGDVEALANAVNKLLTNPDLAARMGMAGREMALERFDEQVVFEKVKADYSRLLREKGLSVPPVSQPSDQQVQLL